MDHSELTLVRATPEQAVQTYKNHWPTWGEPNQLPYDQFVRMIEVNEKLFPNNRWAVWVLVPRNDPTTLDVLAHCETYQRPALHLAAGASTPTEVSSYGIAGVFCAPNHKGHNYAKHMMKLLHYVLAPHDKLPPFPAKWGAPPPTEGFQDATFSILYSGIGTKYYQSCTKGEHENGWVYHQVTSRIWTLPPSPPAAPPAGDWKILMGEDMGEMERVFSQELRSEWSKEQDTAKDSLVVLPDGGIFILPVKKHELFAKEGKHPAFPPGEPVCGVKTPTGWMIGAQRPQKDGSLTFKVMHVSGTVPWEAVLAAAKEAGCHKVEYWGPYDRWDGEKEGLEIKEDDELPSIAAYGIPDDQVAWTVNEE